MSPNDLSPGQRCLPRAPHMNGVLESPFSATTVQQETTNSLLQPKGATTKQKKPLNKSKHDYVARLLGEHNVKKYNSF